MHFAIHIVWRANVICTYRKSGIARKTTVAYPELRLLGNKIKSLRDEQGILQRQVAAYLEIDTPMFSKIERGDRRAKRSQVIQMATYFKVNEKEMLTLWLADKILSDLEGEEDLKLTAIETAKSELMNVNR